MASDTENEIGGKAVELRSYIDPTKGANSWFFAFLTISNRISCFKFSTADNDSSLHTQLWIDPAEEFVQYTHSGDPVDVTFGVKELKV
jgi:cell cycle checkpoint control protein RAD9A